MKASIKFYKAVRGVTGNKMNVEIKYEFDLAKQRKAINESLDQKGIKERNYIILGVRP